MYPSGARSESSIFKRCVPSSISGGCCQRPRESSHRLRFYKSRRTRRVMRLPSKFTALVCCIVLIVLAGAGTTLRGQTGGFAYVANLYSNNVSAYTIDGTTGALTPVAGSPFATGSAPVSVTVDPTG